MVAVNDNLKTEFKHSKCFVFLNSAKLTFTHVLEAKDFIDDYYAREL